MMTNNPKKDNIPITIKKAVWDKYSIYPSNPEITKCRTCYNLVMIPESIRKINNISYDIKSVYINGKIKHIRGVAEFGHIISEKNGGKVTTDNLIIQCKTCNTKLGTNNININHFTDDCEMIDTEYDNIINTEMGENSETCQGRCSSNKQCKNKPIFNRRFCHIHLTN